jgi:hypothetical protein
VRSGFRLPAFGARLLLVAACGCTTLPLPDPRIGGPYGRALEKATRRTGLYSGLETRAFVRATYLSPEFVAAQATELSRVRAEPPAQAAARLARMLDENKVPSFFVALYTPARDWNDLQEPNSVWRLAVDLGHGQIDRPKVVRVERHDPELLGLYPYLDVYSVGYFVRFEGEPQQAPAESFAGEAITSAIGRVQFLAAGVVGKVKLEWTLPGGNASAATPRAPADRGR